MKRTKLHETPGRRPSPMSEELAVVAEDLADVLTENWEQIDVTELAQRAGPDVVVPSNADSEVLAQEIADRVLDSIRDDVLNVAMYVVEEIQANSEDEYGSSDEPPEEEDEGWDR